MKYRIKQEGQYFYPQWKRSFSLFWNFFQTDESTPFNIKIVEFLTLNEAITALNEYTIRKAVVIHSYT